MANYIAFLDNSTLRQELEYLRHDIDESIDLVAKLEYEINTFRSAGFTGFTRFDLFSKDEQEYLKDHYNQTFEMVQRLEDEKKYLENLREEYQNIHDALMIRFYESMGYIEKTKTKPVMIEDSDVFDESAFGPEIYVE